MEKVEKGENYDNQPDNAKSNATSKYKEMQPLELTDGCITNKSFLVL